ncbi:hypothetical protein O0I10_002434 [Lichtheimia ornata]|uniref:Methylated-DNA--protein-cysteine methyltransferase n=1 Tax=Lichtheimia ornata TaxID=688661 RepID=A0AAD7Y2P0_9FUNG|nr:uncharacterized protein O0I10_002434 [Lichtheimia ornata]KAJ8661627.1 hypothetical protein O0I10_002434 [Lichtheimia ornata]
MRELRTRTAKVIEKASTKKGSNGKSSKRITQTITAKDDDVTTFKEFPTSKEERATFINVKTKRIITPFQYQVYDLCAQIPCGQLSTYKAISDALKSHPRAVGQALRLNPFCPLPVPCHRVIASDLAIGGFSGGWGDCQFVADKKAKLAKEGCVFDEYYQFQSNADGKKEIFTDFQV